MLFIIIIIYCRESNTNLGHATLFNKQHNYETIDETYICHKKIKKK